MIKILKQLSNKTLNEIISKNPHLRQYNDETDLDRFGTLVANEWNMGWKQANCTKEYATKTYAQLCAVESQYLLAYTDEHDNMIGIIGLKCDDLINQKNTNIQKTKKLRKSKLNQMYNSPKAGKPNVLRQHQIEVPYIEQIQHACSKCELSILLLDTHARGSGAAIEMFNTIIEIMEQLKQLNKTNHFDTLSIFTTTFCTYQFYEKIGCRRIASIEKFDDEDKGETDYIYLYELKN